MAESGSQRGLPRVAVVGAGLLGTRIAGELALHGCTVHIYDYNSLTVQTVHSTITAQLQELQDQGLLQPLHQIKGSVIAESILSSAVSEADIVFEAIVEDVDVKNSLFKDIASICSRDTLLCSSTLQLPLEDIFNGVTWPERTLGVRFLYPVYFIDSVEMMFHEQSSLQAQSQVESFLRAVGKKTFPRHAKDFPKLLSTEEAKSVMAQNLL